MHPRGADEYTVAHARERFLARDEPVSPVRDEILASWKRSVFWGVAPDDLELPYRPDIDFESRLVRAARPVLDRLETQLAGTRTSMILTDAHGLVLDRRADDDELRRRLDAISLAPGFSYAEEHVGTNGIGTAIEAGTVSYVYGPEHYTDRLQRMSCAGAPVRDPLTGRLEGIIDLTTRSDHANPLMPALAQETATLIEQRMAETGSERERALLRAFMAADRAGHRPIVSTDGELIIANSAAAHLLAPSDHEMLRERAADPAGGISEEILLSQGQAVRLRSHSVRGAGTVVEIHVVSGAVSGSPVHERPAAPPPGLAGGSPGWRRICRLVEFACRGNGRLLLRGEPGVGKLAVVRAVHRRVNPAGRFVLVDGEDLAGDPAGWLAGLQANLTQRGSTVVFHHLDRLSEAAATRLAGLLDSARDGAWIVATINDPQRAAFRADLLLPSFGEVLVVPPLRHRIDDVRDLVPVLLRRHAAHRHVACSPEALHTLMRAPWPGNVTQLDRVLAAAVATRPTGRIEPGDLPDECRTTSRHVLTPMEAMERDAIVRALAETGGDKRKAAARLGISRATIYRKIRAFGIDVI